MIARLHLVCLLVLAACTPASRAQLDAAGSVADAASRADAAPPDSAAADRAGADRGQRDGFSLDGFSLDGFSLDLSGYDLSFDAALEVYEGVAEEGVVCGAETCALGTPCCAGLGVACLTEDSCQLSVPIPCDGPEDCGEAELCCTSGSGLSTRVACVAAEACEGRRFCVTSADCVEGEVCCTSGTMADLGLEAGWCRPEGC